MRHASLFSGVGGFDLSAEWMGWENVFHCEWNEFGKRVLKHYWPKAISYDDITKTDFTIHRGRIDVLTGGFPCQPYSVAGKRLGKEDERHLWPEMLRAIREIQPRWVVGENVRGLVNWSGGMVFDEVQADLEAEGYEVTAYILPACAKDAPHRRDRVWFVAYRAESGIESVRGQEKCEDGFENVANTPSKSSGGQYEQRPKSRQPGGRNSALFASDANGNKRRKRRLYSPESEVSKRNIGSRNARGNERNTWQNFPTQSPICGGDDGLPTELDGITLSKWRNESIKAYGNAVVPHIPYEIFRAIEEYEKH